MSNNTMFCVAHSTQILKTSIYKLRILDSYGAKITKTPWRYVLLDYFATRPSLKKLNVVCMNEQVQKGVNTWKEPSIGIAVSCGYDT